MAYLTIKGILEKNGITALSIKITKHTPAENPRTLTLIGIGKIKSESAYTLIS